MKTQIISVVMAASFILVGCGKKSVSDVSISSPSTNLVMVDGVLTNLVIPTNSIWAQQRRADEVASTNGDAKASQRVCIGNLRQIDAAKDMWALENHKQKGDVPTEADLMEYMPPGQSFPVCPSGGTYVINAVGVLPTCSIPNHAIPATR
jgi:hypothetical protein